MSKFWSTRIQDIKPYVPGEQPQDKKYVKLNTNENPYPPSTAVIEAIKKATDEGLRLYPDPLCRTLRSAISGYYDVSEEQVFVGNGSDEVLAFAYQAFFNPGGTILYPDITYSFYPVYSKMFDVKENLKSLTDDFDVVIGDYKAPNNGVIIANPNAPTGKLLSIEEIKMILEANSEVVVIVDEAYIDFGGTTAVKLVKDYENLLVVQTMSKSRSLAGMRIGMAMGQAPLIAGLNMVKNSINSYTLDRLALVAGAAAMKDTQYFEETCQKIIATRKWVTQQLEDMDFVVPESKANFVFAAPQTVNAKKLFLGLKEKGVLVRYFDQPRINGYLRISIGTDEEMQVLIDGIQSMI